MRKQITKKLCLFVALIFPTMGWAQFGPINDLDAKYATQLVKAGDIAPDIKLNTADGKTFRLSKLRGKYVVLDFWASWCPDCRKDIPDVLRMYHEFRSKGIEFVGVSFDTDPSKWKSAIAKYGLDYPQVSELKRMRESEVAGRYGVKWIPSMVLVSPEGKVELATVLTYKMEKALTELTATKEPVQGTQERVTIAGSKGQLAAIIQKPALEQGRRVPFAIIMHGFTGRKDSRLLQLIADSLQCRGIASLRFDFNGHGESEGKFEDMTVLNEIEDAKKVFDYVSSLPYAGRIVLVGHSQGGVVASMTAGELGGDKVSAVVLLAPAAVLREDAIRGNTQGALYDPLDPPATVKLPGRDLSIGAAYIRTAYSLPIYETASRYQGPALMLHGNEDHIVPYTYSECYQKI